MNQNFADRTSGVVCLGLRARATLIGVSQNVSLLEFSRVGSLHTNTTIVGRVWCHKHKQKEKDDIVFNVKRLSASGAQWMGGRRHREIEPATV